MILSIADLEPYRDAGLCGDGLDAARDILGDAPRPVRELVAAYLAADGDWRNVVRAYAVLVRAQRLPERGLVWRWAELAFREQPERNAALRRWGQPGALGPDTWHAAYAAADAAYAAADAAYAAADAAAYAADAAYAAAYAADAAAAYAAAADAADAAYAAAYADAAADAAYAAADRVRDEIVETICAALEEADDA